MGGSRLPKKQYVEGLGKAERGWKIPVGEDGGRKHQGRMREATRKAKNLSLIHI